MALVDYPETVYSHLLASRRNTHYPPFLAWLPLLFAAMTQLDLDLSRFFKAANPALPLDIAKPEDAKYYINFASVRGGRVIDELKRTIVLLSPDDPTCQLFTGHIGCGKSTELMRLKKELEDQDFYVVYFESSQDLDLSLIHI